MTELFQLSGIAIEVVLKDIKHVHLTVHPPDGRVRMAAPRRTPLETLRLYAISKLPWIRRQQELIRAQERETNREYLDRESHYVWGERYLLRLVETDAPPHVELTHHEMVVSSRHIHEPERIQQLLASWYRDQLRQAVGPFLEKWSATLGVQATSMFVQHMKTRWGSCNPKTGTIRLNTELAKKPVECLEYVTLHELAHLLEPSHNERFLSLMDFHLPGWTHLRDMLNQLPVGHEDWKY